MFGRLKYNLVAVALCAGAVFAANGEMKGDGSAEAPFQIEDYEDLKAIGMGDYLYTADYVLTKDIDASASRSEICNGDGCNGFRPIGFRADRDGKTAFIGKIDGQYHTIRNLWIWSPCENGLGFISTLHGTVFSLNFDSLSVLGGSDDAHDPTSNRVGGLAARAVGATISNVHITNGHIEGQSYVGGVVGEAKDSLGRGYIGSSSYQGSIKGKRYVGGVAGFSRLALILCSADVHIYVFTQQVDRSRKAYSIGGLVGEMDYISIQESFATGAIVPMEATTEMRAIGGLVGFTNTSASVNQSYAAVDVGISLGGDYFFEEDIGGLVGRNNGRIRESFATGNVVGNYSVGGLVGFNLYGDIYNSYALGTVKSPKATQYIGGLVGKNDGGVYASYSAGKVESALDSNGQKKGGGLIGYGTTENVDNSYWNLETSGLDTSSGGVGLSESAMRRFASFAGWDTIGYHEMSDWYLLAPGESCDGHVMYDTICVHPLGEYISTWTIDEGKSYPYLAENVGKHQGVLAIARPTRAESWTEEPVIAAENDVGHELVGKWLSWSTLNPAKDSIYYGYRIGYVDGGDTVWGTSSYMAVPNIIRIASFDDLKKIGKAFSHPLSANYELVEDIDASASSFGPIGGEMGAFTGKFDGKNHTIKNLTVNEPRRSYAGLFGYVEFATIRNLKLLDAKVTGTWYVGALAGVSRYSVVSNVVSLNGNVSGTKYVGGLIGTSVESRHSVLAATGSVKADGIVGGIAGFIRYSVLQDAFSVSTVRGLGHVGGLVGAVTSEYNQKEPLISRSYSASIVKAPKSNNWYTGHAIADMSSDAADTTNCFFDSSVAGLIDTSDVGANKNGLPTVEMLKQSTYKDYDFESVWEIQEGISYPYFKGMDPVLPGIIEDDGTVSQLAGEGTEKSPYLITSYQDLTYIGKYQYTTDLYYMVTQHIALSASAKDNCNEDGSECKGFEPIPEFSGVFIGNNKSMLGLTINRPDEDSVGLFRSLTSTARVTGLMLDSMTINGKKYVGAIAGVDNGAYLDSIYVEVYMEAQDYAGGVVGKKTGGSIVRAMTEGSVSGDDYVGGIAGSLNRSVVTDCFSAVMASGTKDVGGFVGAAKETTMKNVFAVGKVDATSKFGGFAGEASTSTFTSAYYDSVLWVMNVSAGGEPRTTQEMVMAETFKGWDFGSTWGITENSSYPYLEWLAWRKFIIYPYLDMDPNAFHMAGSGTEDDPFVIKTYTDLKCIGYGKYKLSAVYSLANDIDASASREEQSEVTGFVPIAGYRYNYLRKFGFPYESEDNPVFTGTFHGNGHTVRNLYMAPGYDAGFFRIIGESGSVDNLGLEVADSLQVEAMLVYQNYGTINSVGVHGNTYGGSYTGFVKENYGTITNSYITGISTVGRGDYAFVYKNYGAIENSFAKMNYAAAFAYENDGSISKSYFLGNGGEAFTRLNYGSIDNCYANGVTYFVLVNEPENEGNTVRNSYVSGNYCQSSFDNVTSQVAYENVYYENSSKDCSLGGRGTAVELDSTAMRLRKNFAGFDFDSVWYIKDGMTYPLLRGMPNEPYMGTDELSFDDGKTQKEDVRAGLLDNVVLLDSSRAVVLKFDLVSERLLDSLEKAGAKASGEFEISYRVGFVLLGDTVWSAVRTTLTLESKEALAANRPAGRFNATLDGANVALRFGLPVGGEVKFSLLDMQGRVARSFNLGTRAAGDYFESLAVESLARGRYVGVLQVDGRVTEKALLLKR